MPKYKTDIYIADHHVMTYFTEAPSEEIASEMFEEILDNDLTFLIEELDD